MTKNIVERWTKIENQFVRVGLKYVFILSSHFPQVLIVKD